MNGEPAAKNDCPGDILADVAARNADRLITRLFEGVSRGAGNDTETFNRTMDTAGEALAGLLGQRVEPLTGESADTNAAALAGPVAKTCATCKRKNARRVAEAVIAMSEGDKALMRVSASSEPGDGSNNNIETILKVAAGRNLATEIRQNAHGSFTIAGANFRPETLRGLFLALRATPATLAWTLREIPKLRLTHPEQKAWLVKIAKDAARRDGRLLTEAGRNFLVKAIIRRVSDTRADQQRQKEGAIAGAMINRLERQAGIKARQRNIDARTILHARNLRRREPLLRKELAGRRRRSGETTADLGRYYAGLKASQKKRVLKPEKFEMVVWGFLGRLKPGLGWRPDRRFISPAEFRKMPANGSLDPHRLRTSQATVSEHHSDGKTITENAKALVNGSLKPKDVPPIWVVEYRGRIYTFDHRRLVAFRRANNEVRSTGKRELKIQYKKVKYEELDKEQKERFLQVPFNQNGRYIVNQSGDGGRGTVE